MAQQLSNLLVRHSSRAPSSYSRAEIQPFPLHTLHSPGGFALHWDPEQEWTPVPRQRGHSNWLSKTNQAPSTAERTYRFRFAYFPLIVPLVVISARVPWFVTFRIRSSSSPVSRLS